MLYELRVYHMHPGRLPAIHKRFREVTLGLFAEHGIHVCDFYEDADGAERIYYVCSFPDRAARDAAFASFEADPRWRAAFDASHADGGPIVAKVENFFMTRVPYVQPEWALR